MADYIISLTDDQDLAYQARVAWFQAQAEMDPPVFPPPPAVADVHALLMSQLEPNIAQTVQWYLTQTA